MKFTCTQDNFLKGLSQVVPVASHSSQLPVLQHILLQVKDNILHLTATDLEIGVHTIVGGRAQEDGSCTVPARKLLDYVQQLPRTNPITLERQGGGILIETEGFRATFPAGEAEDFPLLPDVNLDSAVDIDPALFGGALEQVLFAASREDIRPEIRSVFIEAGSEGARVAATDSFRLAEKTIPFSAGEAFQFILPLPSAQEVVRLFSGQDAFHVLPHSNHVAFQSDTLELTTRLVDGQYPDYRQIIPRSSKVQVRLQRDELLRALKTLTVFLSADSKRVQLEISSKGKVMHLSVVGGEAGQGDVEVSLEKKTGDGVSALLNIQYLIEGLQHMTTKFCDMYFNGPEDPVVLKPAQTESDYTYLVMPIQA